MRNKSKFPANDDKTIGSALLSTFADEGGAERMSSSSCFLPKSRNCGRSGVPRADVAFASQPAMPSKRLDYMYSGFLLNSGLQSDLLPEDRPAAGRSKVYLSLPVN